MKRLFIILVLLISGMVMAFPPSPYFNMESGAKQYTLPNPLVFSDKAIFNPKWPAYRMAGWYRLRVDTNANAFGYVALATNYSLGFQTEIVETNGLTITNTLTNSEQIVFEHIMLLPIVIDKPEIIQAAEAQYVGTWHYLFGADAGYTNAEYDAVAVSILQIAQTNPPVLATTHAMERSFLLMRDWWTNASGRTRFHPYPWSASTNIVVKDVIGIP